MRPRLWLLALSLFFTGCSESTRDIAIHAESTAARALFISIAVPVLSVLTVIVLLTRKTGKRKENDHGPQDD